MLLVDDFDTPTSLCDELITPEGELTLVTDDCWQVVENGGQDKNQSAHQGLKGRFGLGFADEISIA